MIRLNTRLSLSLVLGMMAFGIITPAALHAQKSKLKTPAYHKVATVTIGGEGGWDYLTCDPAAHRLYITRGTHVMLMDTLRNVLVGDIPNTPAFTGSPLPRNSTEDSPQMIAKIPSPCLI